jgi:hypothetical protein
MGRRLPHISAALAAAFGMTACMQTASAPSPSQAATVAGETFRGTKPEIIRLAIKAIQSKGWKLDQVNESIGLVSFETTMSFGSWSGVAATLVVEEAGANLYRVSGTAKQNLRGGQLAAFDIGGEAQSVVREAVAAMRALQTR